jgi:hypothetical protein
MPLIPNDQLAGPLFSSTLVIGPPKTGKSESTASLHRFLRLHNLPTKIAYFDLDGDGSEPLIRLAREGRELHSDKPKTVEPWTQDLMIYRYTLSRRTLVSKGNTPNMVDTAYVPPVRDEKPAFAFMDDFNTLDMRLDPATGIWKQGQELGAIVFDPLNALQDFYEDFMFKLRKKEIGGTGLANSGIEWDDWRLIGEKTLGACMAAKAFPCYFVACVHEDIRTEKVHGDPTKPSGGGSYIVPLLTYTLAFQISGKFSAIAYSLPNFKWLMRPGAVPGTGINLKSAGSRGRDSFPTEPIEQNFELILST